MRTNYTLKDVEVSLLGGSVYANVMIKAREDEQQEFYNLALKEIEDVLKIEGLISSDISMRDIEIGLTDRIHPEYLMKTLEGYHISCK